MVNPFELNYKNATTTELEEFMLFCIAVAGKNATITSMLLRDMWEVNKTLWPSPFEYVKAHRNPRNLADIMRQVGFGCYNVKAASWWEMACSGVNLRTVSIEELESFYGIGPKTSRFFVLHTRDNVRCACLDTHVLKFLRDCGHKTPKSTPSSKKQYRFLEGLFLEECDKRGVDPKEFDLEVWTKYTKNKKEEFNAAIAHN